MPSTKTPLENDDVRHAAAGNLAFMLSAIRSGEALSPAEEVAIQKTIGRLGEPACIACPVEVRGIYAVAFNLLNLRNNPERWERKIAERLDELQVAVSKLTPIVEEHFKLCRRDEQGEL